VKVYLAVPLRNNRNKLLAKQLFDIIKSQGFDVLSDWILLDDPNPNLNAQGIYERDYKAIKLCDLFLAEISNPSTGVGMEIMLAKLLGKKIFCFHEKNSKVSNFLLGTPEISIIKYDNIHLKSILIETISSVNNQSINNSLKSKKYESK